MHILVNNWMQKISINFPHLSMLQREDSSVSIVIKLYLARPSDTLLLEKISTGCGAYPASYSMTTKGFFPGVKY